MPRVTTAMVTGGRALGEPRLSPDGSLVAFVASGRGPAALVVAPADGSGCETVVSTEPVPHAARADGGGVFDWAPDGTALVYAATDGGLHLQPVDGSPGRPLAPPHPDGALAAPAVSPDGTRVAYVVGLRHVAVASLDPSGPWPVRLTTTADFAADPAWSPDGTTVAWHEWDDPDMPWDASRIVVRRGDGTGDVEVVAGGAGVAVAQPRWAPDGRLGFLSDAEGGWLNVWVAAADGTGAAPLVPEPTEHGGPTWGQGIRTWCWSPTGTHVAYRTNEDGFSRLVVVEGADTDWRWTVAKAVHHGLSWQGTRIAALRTGARTPNQVVTYEIDAVLASVPERRAEAEERARAVVDEAVRRAPGAGAGRSPEEVAALGVRQLARSGLSLAAPRRTIARGPVAGWDAAELPEPELVRWAGPGGQQVVGRLYRPAGVASPPLLCWVHGGPTDQWLVGFNPRFGYFLDRGWAILVPDHRGSTGHGRAFAQALRGRWGDLDVEDCAAGMRAVRERAAIDGDRMVAIGGSAGGFTVLHLLARHPDLCAAAVALYPVTDLVELARSTHRFEKHYTDGLVGPLPDAYDLLVARSPLRVVEAVRVPVLLLHGTADPVVDAAQSREYAARLAAQGVPVEHHEYADEGHGWGDPATVRDELTRIERFLDRHVTRRS